jgi:hypothetical protein
MSTPDIPGKMNWAQSIIERGIPLRLPTMAQLIKIETIMMLTEITRLR